MASYRFRSRRLRLICKLSFRSKIDRTYGHLLRSRRLRGLSMDARRERLVEVLHVNLEQFQDATWSMPKLNSGRRTAESGEALCFDFRECRLTLPSRVSERFAADCRVRAAQGGSSWMPCNEAPRCLPELVAKTIFDHHTLGANFDPMRSGAEWWAQFRENGSAKSTIKFHWDADEFALDHHDVGLHPHLSTVTYLTDSGTPTLVLNCRGLENRKDTSPCGQIPSGLYSFPRFGKHIVFDGQLLHGNVPDDSLQGDRITFLVNIWLDHRPSKAHRLPGNLLPYFGSADAEAVLSPLCPPKNVLEDPHERAFQAKVERHVYRYTLAVPLPLSCDTAILKWTRDAHLHEA